MSLWYAWEEDWSSAIASRGLQRRDRPADVSISHLRAPSPTESCKATGHIFRDKMVPFHFLCSSQICEVAKQHEHKEVPASV